MLRNAICRYGRDFDTYLYYFIITYYITASSKVCVGRETGDELSLKFHSDVRTYVQWIEYSVE